MSSSALPLNVRCPRCGADVGWPCKTPSGAQSLAHRARWIAVGIVSPTDWDLLRDAEGAASEFGKYCPLRPRSRVSARLDAARGGTFQLPVYGSCATRSRRSG
ncbi:zinc finger domain-containing protein [Cupriavidus sp. Met-2]|uniref:zinc finger domain-containing protein n=1 Tax=Cupriavidus sp. Met-2 TaxID=3132825 RepID=UPI003CE453CA